MTDSHPASHSDGHVAVASTRYAIASRLKTVVVKSMSNSKGNPFIGAFNTREWVGKIGDFRRILPFISSWVPDLVV